MGYEYKILEGMSPSVLEGKVIAHLKNGWELVGGVAFTNSGFGKFFQAMKKIEPLKFIGKQMVGEEVDLP